MKSTTRQNILSKLLCLFIILSFCFTCQAKEKDKDIYKYYNVGIQLFSIDPNQPFDSYKSHGSGSSGDGGMLGHYFKIHDCTVRVNIHTKNVKGLLISNVAVIPDKKNSGVKAINFDVDFPNMMPRSYELAKDNNGRVYMLNLTPDIKILDIRPKRADSSAFELSRWVLADSFVIFNDSFYAGKLGCSGGPLAYVSYPGIAKVEFAPEPFRDAKLLGTLKDGRIQIIHSEDGQTLDIYGVRNGCYEMQLPGGPYEVWVRWQNLPKEAETKIPPKEEWIQIVKAKFAEMGNTPPSDEELDKSYEKIKYEKHLPLSSGVGPIRKADKI